MDGICTPGIGLGGWRHLLLRRYGLPFATDVAIGGASLVEPDRLWIWLGCGDDASATATEDQTSVTIHARLQARQGDCATSAEVQLDGPLGERILIDGYDRKQISIDR